MTTNIQIQDRLQKVPGFVGVYDAQQDLPDPKSLRHGSHFIANYGQDTHWVWVYVGSHDKSPLYLDPLGFSSNGFVDSRALDIPNPRFDLYLKACCRQFGWNFYMQNTHHIERVNEDICGEISCLGAILDRTIPNDRNGSINSHWREIIFRSRNMSSESFQKWIIAKVGLRK